MTDNPSFVLKSIENTAFENRDVPSDIGPDEVLVEVKKTGVHYLVHGRIGDFVVTNPMVLGHESSGFIYKVGSNVKHVAPGDRVAMEPGATCGQCEYCKGGKYNLCADVIFAATPPYHGTLCRYYRLPGHLAYPLPANVSLEDGAMIEPLGVGVHSVSNLGNFRAGQSIAVFGCGPVGLLCMAVAKAIGAARIIAIDISEERLAFAKTYAATDAYLPTKQNKGESNVDYSKRNATAMKGTLGIAERGPRGLDLIIDASGAEVCIQTGFHIAKVGGIFVQVGMGNPNVTVDMGVLETKELVVKGSFRYGPGDYNLAIALVAGGKINLKPLVTHRYAFERALEAFQATRAGKSPDGKGVIKAIISGPGVSPDSV
ncbi:xylitol dehydrogenase [Fistulina hepatica ATCC 64428]|nr:xylitol dehydrogenase [Fistulina hepatica ATCC 64428]